MYLQCRKHVKSFQWTEPCRTLQLQLEEGIQQLLERAKDQNSVLERSELLKLKGQLRLIEQEIAQERLALSTQHQTHFERMVSVP
jgi:hypothetical protein